MERSLSSLKFEGSIVEAISEAKQQKKLLLVYISGENEDSRKLEDSTWTNLTVAESVSKYCILLHIQEGSIDAANFSVIYPQNSVPCITAVGYNGVLLWKSEGFVSAEYLTSSLVKAYLSLHIQENLQETTATVLTAALASRNSEPSTSAPAGIFPSDQGSSSGVSVHSPSIDKIVQSSEGEPSIKPEVIKESSAPKDALESTGSEGKMSFKSSCASKLSNLVNKQSTSSAEAAKRLGSVGDDESPFSIGPDKEIVRSVMIDTENPISCQTSSSPEGGCPTIEKDFDHHLGVPGGYLELSDAKINEDVQHVVAERLAGGKVDTMDNSASVNKLSDVHLNIRLPDGVSLQEKFPLRSTLGMVKDYVDRNQTNHMGAYDLAIPYPRKVFNDQDLSVPLSELGLSDRQALIVVPHQGATGYNGGGSCSSTQTNSAVNTESSNENNGGYFGLLRRIFSFMNPFSYLGGGASSSHSGQESQTGMWEYGPNPTLRNNFAQTERRYTPYSPNRSTLTRNDGRSRQSTTSHFGSNIHTLKHDEDDNQFADRNAFWNGNSTQYGGDNDGK